MQPPRFSIVIPTHARPAPLSGCLEALTRLEYPEDRFEVIVVDDGSPVSPEKIVAPFRGRLAISLVLQPHSGPAKARNTGAARAKGEFLAFTDDDCLPPPEWLRKLEKRLEVAPGHLIAGRTVNTLPDNPCATASQLILDYLHNRYNRDGNNAQFVLACNMAVAREIFRATGGFDPRWPLAGGEDREFSERWHRQGRPVTYAPEAVVGHAHDLSFPAYCRQQFAYGRGAVYFRQACDGRCADSTGFEPVGFYLDLLRYPWRHGRSRRAVLLSALLLVSQTAIAAGYLCQQTGLFRVPNRPRS